MASKALLTDGTLHLKLSSTFDNLERAVNEAEAFMSRMTNDDDLAYRVVLLTSEAVTNAMEHGNKWDAEKHITLDLIATRARIELQVGDEGGGYESSDVPDPRHDDNVFNGRGRGLFFMEELASELHLEREGCLLRLIFYR